jgi:uncharacterized protein YfaT (DUF1175 family)
MGGTAIVSAIARQLLYLFWQDMTSRQSRYKWMAFIALALSVLFNAGCQSFPPARAAHTTPAKPVTSWADEDADGLPDRIELRSFDDRANFRRWFTAIAEQQFYTLSAQWNSEQRDCAGLVRFAWREALRTHDRLWFQAAGIEAVAPDVKAFVLERSPVGEKLFRTDYGAFAESDLTNGKMSEFSDARTLKNHNVEFVSRDRRQAEPGDLLFYHQPWVQTYPYHVMIFLGAARQTNEGAADWVVYHTGASAKDKGEVRKARLTVLDKHPDPRWRPMQTNKHFLGFYRLKVLG